MSSGTEAEIKTNVALDIGVQRVKGNIAKLI